MKRFLPLIIGVAAVLALTFFIARATYAAPFPYAVGGTGSSTPPAVGQVFYAGKTAWQSVATTSVTCSGSTSCSSFTAIGNSPITISSSGGSGGSGNVATSTHEVSGQVATFSSNSATPATIAGNNDFTFVDPLLYAKQASTSLFSVFSKAYFGGTATDTINSTGDLLVVGSTTLQNFTGLLATTSAATTTAFAITNAGSALLVTNAGGTVGKYGGTGNCGGGTAVTALSALGAATCTAFGTGSVTSIATTWPISGGTITTSGTLTWAGIATSSNIVNAQALYATGVNTFASSANHTLTAVLDTITNASTTNLTVGTYFQPPTQTSAPSNTAGGSIVINDNSQASSSIAIGDGTNTNNIFAVHSASVVLASSTLAYYGSFGAAGTTTTAIAQPIHSSTLLSARCRTDVGTAYIVFGNGSATTTAFQCTSGNGAASTISSNNTWSGGQIVWVGVGDSASSPNIITITADVIDRN